MPGKIRRPRDHEGKYRTAVRELCAELGFAELEVWHAWEQCALMHEYEQKLPRAAAEAFALEDVRAIFDKRGKSGADAN